MTAEMIACHAGCVDGTSPDAERDRTVPAALRRKVLAREGNACLACGCRHRLQAHHVVPFSEGGTTTLDNLITLCRRCHAAVHTGLLTIEGDAGSGWRFVRNMPELPGDGPRLSLDHLAAGPPQPTTSLSDLPCELEPGWWAAHAHLIRFNERLGTFELRCGVPREPRPGRPATGAGNGNPLRPARLAEVVGQDAVVSALKVAVDAARRRGEPMDHTLLCGAPGLGKTTIARAVAGELGAGLHSTSGPVCKSPAALVQLLAGLQRHDVVFIDEIHALPSQVMEMLYEAIEDCRVSLLVTCGAEARTLTLRLEPFTLIGATTDRGQVSSALISRFAYREQLGFYGRRELTELIGRASRHLNVRVDSDAASALASVSRQTPREALRLLRRVRNEAHAGGRSRADAAFVSATLDRLGIDGDGLGPLDRAYLKVLRERGPGRPLGIGRLAAILGVDAGALEREHEPYLFRRGLATTTPHGRIALN
jgi:Holliday junction DNA helicase RuvB